jgi:hypothetical protein
MVVTSSRVPATGSLCSHLVGAPACQRHTALVQLSFAWLKPPGLLVARSSLIEGVGDTARVIFTPPGWRKPNSKWSSFAIVFRNQGSSSTLISEAEPCPCPACLPLVKAPRCPASEPLGIHLGSVVSINALLCNIAPRNRHLSARPGCNSPFPFFLKIFSNIQSHDMPSV